MQYMLQLKGRNYKAEFTNCKAHLYAAYKKFTLNVKTQTIQKQKDVKRYTTQTLIFKIPIHLFNCGKIYITFSI